MELTRCIQGNETPWPCSNNKRLFQASGTLESALGLTPCRKPPVKTRERPGMNPLELPNGLDPWSLLIGALTVVVPRGAEIGAIHLAPDTYEVAPECTDDVPRRTRRIKTTRRPKALTVGTLRTALPHDASVCIAESGEDDLVRPEGLEPPTLGSEVSNERAYTP